MADNEHKEIDELSGTATTGHEWDGIKELDTPMPRWWVWIFLATIVFSIGYVIYYPAFPLIEGSTMGISGETTRAALNEELAAATAAKKDVTDKIESTPLEEIKNNEELVRFANSAGASLFKVYCVQCHGSGAQGAPGYPNLNDDDWLWGGSLEEIYTTINHGVRSDDDDDGRYSEMPAFGRDGILDNKAIGEVAEYVLSLSGSDHDAAGAEAGKQLFDDNCAACHGEQGQGDPAQGAPKLADALWLYGGTKGEVVKQIENPKHGVMPAWGSKLGDAAVKELAIYVHGRGGGQ